MADTAVQDPQTKNILVTEPSERKTSDRVTMPWEYDERRFEKEQQSLQDDQAAAVAETERILFPSTGSMMNEFKSLDVNSETIEIQVEDKQVKSSEFNPDLLREMFEKPLKNMTNIAGGIVSETPDALKDLGKQIAGVAEKQTEIQPEKQKEVQVAQWQNFVIQKTGETNAAISKVTMQRKMEEALYIVGAPPTENTAAELELNTSLAVKNLNSIDKYVWMTRKRSEDMKAAKQAEQAQEEVEVRGPRPVANLNEVMEGGLIGGASSHITPINAGG